MNKTEQDPLDWLARNCQPYIRPDGLVTDSWQWPTGAVHTQAASVAIVRMHQAMGREPTDMITAEFMAEVIDRLLAAESKIRAMEKAALNTRTERRGW